MSRPEFDATASAFIASIPEARKAQGMSQAELGRRIGLDASAVTRLEGGARQLSFTDALALSAALGISLPANMSDPATGSLAYIRVNRAVSDLAAMTAEFKNLRDLLAPNADGAS